MDNGGPAFPQTSCNSCGVQHRDIGHEEPGATLLDLFAGMAMQSYIEHWDRMSKRHEGVAGPTSTEGDAYIARYSYRMAQAMVNEKRQLEENRQCPTTPSVDAQTVTTPPPTDRH